MSEHQAVCRHKQRKSSRCSSEEDVDTFQAVPINVYGMQAKHPGSDLPYDMQIRMKTYIALMPAATIDSKYRKGNSSKNGFSHKND